MIQRPLRLAAVLASGVLAACSSTTNTVPATFASPSGLVVAGSEHDLLFIANSAEDALQVGQLTSSLDTFDLVRGDALHFPLRIPVGPEPRRLAATPNGEYVLVLNGTGETVRLVDAVALTPAADADRKALVAAVGPAGSVPADMVVAPANAAAPNGVGCTGDSCVGRFYVSLSGAGTVMAIEVHETPDPADASVRVPSLVLARAYQVGGTPVSLAIHPGGHVLFATDASSNEVVRLDLDSGEVLDRLPVDDAPGVAAISADGTALIVARPRLRDLVVFTDLDAAIPAQVDADPALVPMPGCLDSCGPDGVPTDAVCSGQHPADAAICSTGTGPAAVPGHTYEALFLGNTPSRIVALGGGPGSADQSPVTLPCSDQTLSFSQALLVGLNGGNLVYVGLRRAGGPLAPELLSRSTCTAPSATVPEKSARKDIEAPALAEILGPCPPAPARARFECTAADGEPGAVVLPGHTGTLVMSLDWEGAVADRTTGGWFEAYTPTEGSSEAPFAFHDEVNGLSAVQPGDILQIMSTPRPNAECQAALGASPSSCLLEWHVLRAEDSGGSSRLVLERHGTDMPLGCFAQDGTIAYRIRAGGIEVEPDGSSRMVGRYLLTHAGTKIARVGPGDVVGMGASLGPSLPALFQLAGPPVPESEHDTCSFYDATGAAVDTALRPFFSRGNPFGLTLTDSFGPVTTGESFFGTNVALPGDMVLVQLPAGGPVELFVTYTAGNALLAFEPYDISKLTETGRHRVFY